MTVFMFPGQGSQIKGMGKDVFDKYPSFVKKADAMLGYSLKALCLENPENKLMKTQFTQPALFVVSVLSYLDEVENSGILPDYVIGHSIGEYAALFASGLLDFEEALNLVMARGDLMSQAENGAMAAIIGLEKEKVERILATNQISRVWVANDNSSTQIVISGDQTIVPELTKLFEDNGASYFVPLNVSGAFHSPLMQEARESYNKILSQASITDVCIPVISNVDATPYDQSKVKMLLSEQITGQVRWREMILYLLERGEVIFKEIGPGDVLTKLVSRIVDDAVAKVA